MKNPAVQAQGPFRVLGKRCEQAEAVERGVATDPEWMQQLVGYLAEEGRAVLAQIKETHDLLTEYAQAKFGDEWWPGNAEPWIGEAKGTRLAELLEQLP